MADLGRALGELRQGVGVANAEARRAAQAAQAAQGQNAMLDQQIKRMQADINNLADSLSALNAEGAGSGDPHIRYIEQIPGRRIPFDLTVSIPIGANIESTQQAPTTISQDGPFIAVARYAAFQSAYNFSFTDPENGQTAAYQGRSYGRFRPTSSVGDIADALNPFQPVTGGALPGTGAGIQASPTNRSNFRTMEFDGVIQFINQGSGWQRQNVDIPSAFYMQDVNSPFLLGALDFFERGETLQWKVTPTHVNNPPYGNVSGFGAGGVFPFIDSQYDIHEGILDPELPDVDTDPVSRLPEGILILGFHGYRIIQPPGPVSMT